MKDISKRGLQEVSRLLKEKSQLEAMESTAWVMIKQVHTLARLEALKIKYDLDIVVAKEKAPAVTDALPWYAN